MFFEKWAESGVLNMIRRTSVEQGKEDGFSQGVGHFIQFYSTMKCKFDL